MIRNILFFFTLLSSTSLGLRQARQGRAIPNVNVLRSTSNKATTVSPLKIDVVSRGIELTDALRNRIDGKIGKVCCVLASCLNEGSSPPPPHLPLRPLLFSMTSSSELHTFVVSNQVLNKLASPPGVVSSQLVLRVHKQKAEEAHSHTTKANSQICELTVVMKGGRVIHSTERSSDMYQSIDVLSHKLAMKLKAAKDKVQDKRGNAKVGGSVAEDEESGGEDLNDEELLMDIDKDYRTKYLSSIPPPLQGERVLLWPCVSPPPSSSPLPFFKILPATQQLT
jgi:ribosomal subunit interface protein